MEDDVDEKYFLNVETLRTYVKRSEHNKQSGIGFRFEPVERERAILAKSITTNPNRGYGNYCTYFNDKSRQEGM